MRLLRRSQDSERRAFGAPRRKEEHRGQRTADVDIKLADNKHEANPSGSLKVVEGTPVEEPLEEESPSEGTPEEKKTGEEVAEKVARAKTDETAFESLVRDYELHMKKTAYRTLGRFIDNSDDEWSVVLLAFHEAVQRYEPDKGTFTSFADMVMKRRLIDEIRRQARRRDEIAVDMSAADETLKADTTDRQKERQNDLKLEIEALSEVLDKYGITFGDLAECSPKAGRTRKQCGRAVNLISENAELLNSMRTGGRLPVKKIIELGKIPPKILERHRRYIIVAVEITVGDYPHLDEYIKRIRMEGRS